MSGGQAKSLDVKLARILADPACGEFILADAKDADMAFGMAAPGRSPEHHADEARFRTLDEYRRLMRDIVKQGLVDIMLMSCSTSEALTIRERLFDGSHVTPAVRANDTTDIWLAAGTGRYPSQPSLPFRTATLDHIQCGHADCSPDERGAGADLGLYSITFNNDAHLDRAALEAYREFRVEAERKGFRHFLEVFDPNAPAGPIGDLGRFINDHIARALAGVADAGRPLFLKIEYHGPAAMEQLAAYDRRLAPGILGGSAGTTFDAFHQLWEAKKHGARVALYGRKINQAEDQLAFIRRLREVADGAMKPDEAVRAYHGDLAGLGIGAHRKLEDDLKLTPTVSAYAGAGTKTAVHVNRGGAGGAKRTGGVRRGEGEPDFSKMTAAEKVAWNRKRWDRILP